MLYDPKWQNTTAKPDVFSLESLIAWLEKQPADIKYCYGKTGDCLLARYFYAFGFSKVAVGGTTVDLDGDLNIVMPAAFQTVPLGHPRTFGIALERARAALKS